MEVYLHTFLISTLHGGVRSASRSSRFAPGKEPGIHWLGGWVGPRADLDAVSKRKTSFPVPARNRTPIV